MTWSSKYDDHDHPPASALRPPSASAYFPVNKAPQWETEEAPPSRGEPNRLVAVRKYVRLLLRPSALLPQTLRLFIRNIVSWTSELTAATVKILLVVLVTDISTAKMTFGFSWQQNGFSLFMWLIVKLYIKWDCSSRKVCDCCVKHDNWPVSQTILVEKNTKQTRMMELSSQMWSTITAADQSIFLPNDAAPRTFMTQVIRGNISGSGSFFPNEHLTASRANTTLLFFGRVPLTAQSPPTPFCKKENNLYPSLRKNTVSSTTAAAAGEKMERKVEVSLSVLLLQPAA